MATNFFERQSAARTSTAWLLLMFCLATIAIVVSVTIVAGLAVTAAGIDLEASDTDLGSQPQWFIPVLCGAGTLLLILGGSFFKVLELRAGGGGLVAERMGGVRIYPNTTDPVERRLLNVVEEMAIATPIHHRNNEESIALEPMSGGQDFTVRASRLTPRCLSIHSDCQVIERSLVQNGGQIAGSHFCGARKN